MAFDAAAIPASLRRSPTQVSFQVTSIGTIAIGTDSRALPVSKLMRGKIFYNPPDLTKQVQRIVRAAPAALTATRYEALLLSTVRAKLDLEKVHSWATVRGCRHLGLEGLVAVLTQCSMPEYILGHILYALGPTSFWQHKTVGVVPSVTARGTLSCGVMVRTVCPEEIWHPYQHLLVFLPLP